MVLAVLLSTTHEPSDGVTPVKITTVDDTPVLAIPCLAPRARGATERDVIPVHVGRVDRLPGEMQALIVTSDLQAREAAPTNRSIGVVVAEAMEPLVRRQRLDPRRVGVILAGDLYTSATLHRRFGVGDVSDVWDAFAARFRWVTGVLGNVDRLAKKARKRHRLLEGDTATLDSLRIAGVSGIIGSPKMENRRVESLFLREVAREVARDPDILVLHEGPSIPGPGLPGNDAVRRTLHGFSGLVVCGHNAWPHPLAALGRASVLNTDGRCLLLRP